MGFQYLRNVVRDLELKFSPVSTMTPVSGPGGLSRVGHRCPGCAVGFVSPNRVIRDAVSHTHRLPNRLKGESANREPGARYELNKHDVDLLRKADIKGNRGPDKSFRPRARGTDNLSHEVNLGERKWAARYRRGGLGDSEVGLLPR